MEKVIYDGCKVFKGQRIEPSVLKRALQKQDLISVSNTFQLEYICDINNWVCLSKAGLVCHKRHHDSKQSLAHFTLVLPQQLISNLSLFCDKVRGCTACLRSHMRVYSGNVYDKDSYLICNICDRACKDMSFVWGVICDPKVTFCGTEEMPSSVKKCQSLYIG